MTAHAGTHKRGGNDPIRLDDLAEPQDNVDLDANTLRHGLLPKLSGSGSDVLKGDGTFGAPGSGALTSDHFVTTQAESDLSAEFNLGSLTTGLLKHAVSAGVSTPATASAGTDYVAPGAITSSGLTQATARMLGRTTASSGAIEEITVGSGLSLASGTLIATSGGTFSGSRVHRTTLQSLTNGSLTAISFDAESYDTDSYHEGVTHPTRLTVPATGKYHVGGTVETTGSPGATSYVALQVNGSTVIAWQGIINDTNAGIVTLSCDVALSSGDYVELAVKVNASSKNAIVADGVDPAMWIHLLGT